MSISVNNIKKSRAGKFALVYLLISAFCGVFSFVYEHFSHGVYSASMIYMFVYPLLGGTAVFAILALMGKKSEPDRFSFNIYNSGIATLSVGSCVKGVLEIYGTDSQYVKLYFIAGIVLLALGVVSYIAGKFKKCKS